MLCKVAFKSLQSEGLAGGPDSPALGMLLKILLLLHIRLVDYDWFLLFYMLLL